MGQQITKDQEQLKNLNCKYSQLTLAVTEKELQKLYKNFSKIDKDKSGMLEPEEFFDIPGKFAEDSTISRVGSEPVGKTSHRGA